MSPKDSTANWRMRKDCAGSFKEHTTEHFVVDVWTKKGDGWQLAARYLSPVSGAAYAPAPAKPTGRH